MAKLDVGVGDEFPTEEIHRDEHGVVHHHHYHRRPRRGSMGFLRILLMVVLVILTFRALHHLHRLFEWDELAPAWMPHGFMPLTVTLLLIAVIGGALYMLRNNDPCSRDRP